MKKNAVEPTIKASAWSLLALPGSFRTNAWECDSSVICRAFLM